MAVLPGEGSGRTSAASRQPPTAICLPLGIRRNSADLRSALSAAGRRALQKPSRGTRRRPRSTASGRIARLQPVMVVAAGIVVAQRGKIDQLVESALPAPPACALQNRAPHVQPLRGPGRRSDWKVFHLAYIQVLAEAHTMYREVIIHGKNFGRGRRCFYPSAGWPASAAITPAGQSESACLHQTIGVIGSPRVVVQAEVDAFGQVGLRRGISNRRHFPQRHHRRIQRLNRKTSLRILVVGGRAKLACICRLPPRTTSNGDTKRSTFSSIHPLGLRGLGKETEPHGFGKPVGRFGEAREIDLYYGLGIGQEHVEKHFSWPRDPAGFFRLGVINAQLRQKPMAALDLPGPAIGRALRVHTRLCAPKFSILGLPKSNTDHQVLTVT